MIEDKLVVLGAMPWELVRLTGTHYNTLFQ